MMSTEKFCRWALIAALTVALVIVAASCSRRIVYVPQVRDSIQIRTEIRVDSVWRDRSHTEKRTGDTITIRDSVTVESFKWLERHDTLTVRDSIPFPVDVPGPVVYKRTGFDKFCTAFFILAILAFLAWLAVKIWRRK